MANGRGLTPKQIGLVHVAKKRLSLDDDSYRAILHGCAGVETAADLDAAGFNAVMAYFTGCGFRSTWTQRTFGQRGGWASPAQVDMIRSLWREWSGADDDAELNKWLERSYHISALRLLDRTAAVKAINGLRAMMRRKKARAEVMP
jgi:Protein of unknown function (DUF1018)